MTHQFTCDRCKNTFTVDTPEVTKVAEAERNFGACPPEEDRASVCDACYEWFMEIYNRVRPDLNPDWKEQL